MKLQTSLLPAFLALSASLVTGCTSVPRKPPVAPAPAAVGKKSSDGKSVQSADDLEEYKVSSVSDPLEPLNRATFAFNDGLYTVLLRPISKGYQFIVPKPVRQGVYNAYENVKFPIRFVNFALQGNFQHAGLEIGKFLANSTAGVGGLWRVSDHVPEFASLPNTDTGVTLAKWHIGNGPYFVIPVLGPSTVRDVFGLAGDYALNPITWVCFVYGDYDWIIAIPTANTLRALPGQMDIYDAVTKNSLDKYLAARSAYIQNRAEAATK